MTEQQINTAIAKACGWIEIEYDPDWGWRGKSPNLPSMRWPIMNYCECLNAMHEAEQFIQDALWENYISALAKVTGADDSCKRSFLCAPARQRAEAFLRALGKWKEVAK